MDISDTLAPKSDQLDAVDLLSGPRIFTVASVSRGNSEQPVQVHLAEFPRVWRPGKSMRRVLAYCWGKDASTWTGRRIELFCDPEVVFGGEKVGGTRIRRMSHIDGPKSVPLLVKRGKSGMYKVDPLIETTESRIADLRAPWQTADPERRKIIEAEVAKLQNSSPAPDAATSAEPLAPPAACPPADEGDRHEQASAGEVHNDGGDDA